jgi:hypothetical protein
MNGPMFGGLGGGAQAADGADAQTMAAVKNVGLPREPIPRVTPDVAAKHRQSALYCLLLT